jgi:hypothetical protein
MDNVPTDLTGRAFTRAEALRLGITDDMLRSRRFTRIHSGVYRLTETTASFRILIEAALLVLPTEASLSHLSCLRLLGFEVGPALPLHFATQQARHRVRTGLIVHRYKDEPGHIVHRGVRVVEPYRTFVDCATILHQRQLLAVGDWLAAHRFVQAERLIDFVHRVHFDGVQRARLVAPLVNARAASPRESDVRWELHCAGLPAPELNVDIYDNHGQWLARGDLVYRAWKLLVEYDGRQHELDPRQRQWDHLRREALEAAGWRLVVITEADMWEPARIVIRVRQALRERGCSV